MPIPKVVQDAADRADAIMSGNRNVQPPQPAAPAAAAPAAPIQASAQPPGSSSQPQGGAPAVESTEHRYAVLQGKYNAEVPALHAQVRQLTGELERANQVVAQLQEQLRTAPPEPAPLIRPEEVEEHGEGLISVVRRAAQEELRSRDSKIAELEAELHQLRGGVGKLSQKTFLQRLTEAVPTWASINADLGFHKWLDQPDDLTGRQRQELLTAAHADGDVEGVIRIFKAFERARDSWAQQAEVALAGQVVPGAGGAGGSPTLTNPGARIWSRAEVNETYRLIRIGQLKGQEAVAAEAEIQLAMKEGRIR